MRLYQNQLWQDGEALFRIVKLERLSVDYMLMDVVDPQGSGRHFTSTKKKFFQLIKNATDVTDTFV